MSEFLSLVEQVADSPLWENVFVPETVMRHFADFKSRTASQQEIFYPDKILPFNVPIGSLKLGTKGEGFVPVDFTTMTHLIQDTMGDNLSEMATECEYEGVLYRMGIERASRNNWTFYFCRLDYAQLRSARERYPNGTKFPCFRLAK